LFVSIKVIVNGNYVNFFRKIKFFPNFNEEYVTYPTFKNYFYFIRLFYHECLRVFHDRLINVEDKNYFYHLLNTICANIFGKEVLSFLEKNLIEESSILLFGDFLIYGIPKENRIYEEIKDISKLKSVLQVSLI
jgi:dynein heavy chain